MSDPAHILGVDDGQNCGASLSCNGEIVASLSEERLSRVKDKGGHPRRPIDEVLRVAGVGIAGLAEAAPPRDHTIRPRLVEVDTAPADAISTFRRSAHRYLAANGQRSSK